MHAVQTYGGIDRLNADICKHILVETHTHTLRQSVCYSQGVESSEAVERIRSDLRYLVVTQVSGNETHTDFSHSSQKHTEQESLDASSLFSFEGEIR